MSTEPAVLAVRDARGVLTLTLNRPASFNALSEEMLAALQAALADWRAPVPRETMEFQIGLAVTEASDVSLIMEMKFEVVGGTTMRMACGSTTLRRIMTKCRPSRSRTTAWA